MEKLSLWWTPFFYLIFLTTVLGSQLFAQTDTISLSLSEVIAIAESDAPAAAIARSQFRKQYWRHQAFLAKYRPQIKLRATLPDLNRSIDAITLSDGSEAFVDRSLMRNQVGIELQQYIPLTGGQLVANTSLQRLDFFNSTGDNSQSYLSVPISIGLRQPIFGFNQLRWDLSIEPLRQAEAERKLSEEQAAIGYQTVSYFFRVLRAQTNWAAAKRNKVEAEALYALAEDRFAVGKIAETELLQLELNARNAAANLAESQFTWENSLDQLHIFIGIPQDIVLNLITPREIPAIDIETQVALAKALQRRSEMIGYTRQVQEAERDLARAEKESGLQLDLFVSFGLSQTAPGLGQAYADPLDQERLQIGVQMPLVDWGEGEARVEIARSNLELTRLQTTQQRNSFERNILTSLAQFDQIKNQVVLASEAQQIAEKRLEITQNRYRVGKIGIMDLSLALSEEANSRRRFLETLQAYWLAFYDLRQLTLFDFWTGEDLSNSHKLEEPVGEKK